MSKMVEVDDYWINPDRYIAAYENREVPHIIHITFFENEFAKTLTASEMTLEELRDFIFKTSAAEKSKLRYLKPAMFGDKPSANNCLRYNDNVRAIFGVATDYDREEMSFDAALGLIRAARLRALIYTSPSYTKGEATLARRSADVGRLAACSAREICRPPQRRPRRSLSSSFVPHRPITSAASRTTRTIAPRSLMETSSIFAMTSTRVPSSG